MTNNYNNTVNLITNVFQCMSAKFFFKFRHGLQLF